MSTEETIISENWIQWQSIESPTRCEACKILHGKVMQIDNLMIEPPLHENCRCKIMAVIAKIAGTATDKKEEGADWYLMNQGELPDYYITKEEAAELGWKKRKGDLSKILPNMMIGGNIYRNDDEKLPWAPWRIWYEADINYISGRRNLERILYSNDGMIFVTYDHYNTFIEIIEIEEENDNNG